VNCQCGRYPDHPCTEAVTQEDLLCDGCRTARTETPAFTVLTGCGTLVRGTEEWAWHVAPLQFTWAAKA
jgi:hypothetical protein